MLTFRIFIVGTSNVGKSTIANSLVGQDISEIGPITDVTLYTIPIILENQKLRIIIFDCPGVGGIEDIRIGKLLKHLKKVRKYLSKKTTIILPLEESTIGKKIIEKMDLKKTKRGKSIILFIFDIINGLKKEDATALKKMKKYFPKTNILILVNKIDLLDVDDIEKSLNHYRLIVQTNYIYCSKRKNDIDAVVSKITQTFCS